MENTNEPSEELGNDNKPQEQEGPTMIEGLKGLGFGLVLFGVAYYFFSTMTKYENGEGVTMNRLLLIAYGALGKNISTGILALLGAFLSFSGIKEMIASNAKS